MKVNLLITDIKVRGNVISTKLRFLSIESKRDGFLAQIGSYYGWELLNLPEIKMHELDLARKVFQIPGMTRSYLLLPLMNSDIPSTNVLIRILKFYFNGINSKDEFIGFIFKNSFYSITSVMCKKNL